MMIELYMLSRNVDNWNFNKNFKRDNIHSLSQLHLIQLFRIIKFESYMQRIKSVRIKKITDKSGYVLTRPECTGN